ncbi:toprim domain-containing protein [Thermoproteota archaeon]
MHVSHQRKNVLKELEVLLKELHVYVDLVLVEGPRDTESLISLGCITEIEILSHTGVNDFDLAEKIAAKYGRVLILTDFDEEGLRLNRHFSKLLERKGVKVENGLRRRVGRLTAIMGVYAIEALDNFKSNFEF